MSNVRLAPILFLVQWQKFAHYRPFYLSPMGHGGITYKGNGVRGGGEVNTIQQIQATSGAIAIIFTLFEAFYRTAHGHVMNAKMCAYLGHSISP